MSVRTRRRPVLLATTALQAAQALMLLGPASVRPAAAQLAPNARPQGGAVVAGKAGISQSATQTTIAQSSQRAAVDWKSFDVGSGQAVVFQQPNTGSITLNRVTGPDPSQIAGKIQANGQVVIVNQNGVAFSRGSQVDVQSLIVSTANVSNSNFMAGRMAFDQPGKPGASISNAGTISVKATGLAALVAPQVANSGTINARMGHVVLAGGEAHTVDLYGDGLMSVDVTRQVRTAPGGGVSLVTNSGVIKADGGTIVLTAKAADGIVTNLVNSSGRLQANTVGSTPGSIEVSAIGGSVSIAGRVQADGTQGGTVVMNASDTVSITSTAHISARGGGTVALGTTAARALAQGAGGIPPGTARGVDVAAGARISANGGRTGNGGAIALLSTEHTVLAGHLSARGGAEGGNGGQIEVSGKTGLSITGGVDTRAPAGKTGLLTIDPTSLTIGGSGPPADTNIPASAFNGFTTDTALMADTITVGDSVLTIGNAAGSLTLIAKDALLVTGRGINQTGPVSLTGFNTLTLAAPVISSGTLTLTGGAITQSPGGTITAPLLTGLATGAVTLTQAGNVIQVLGPFTSNGTFQFTDTPTAGLTLAGIVRAGLATDPLTSAAPNAQPLTITTLGANAGLIIGTVATPAVLAGSTVTLNTAGDVSEPSGQIVASALKGTVTGSVTLTQPSNDVLALGAFGSTGAFSLTDTPGAALTIAGVVRAGLASDPLNSAALNAQQLSITTLGANGGLSIGTVSTPGTLAGSTITLNTAGSLTEPSGQIVARALTGSVAGAVTLTQPGNDVLALAALGSTGAFTITDTPGAGLTILGTVRAGLASDPLNSSAANAQPLSITTLGANGGTNIGTTVTPGTLAGSIVTLNNSGALNEPSGQVVAAVLTGTVAGGVTLAQSGNDVLVLGPFASAGAFSFTDTPGAGLTIAGTVRAGIASDPLTATAPGAQALTLNVQGANGSLAIGTTATPAILAGSTVTINASGGITEPSGAVVASILAGSAASVALPTETDGTDGQQGNQIATLGGFSTTSGNFVLRDSRSLSVTGPVSAAGNVQIIAQSGAGTPAAVADQAGNLTLAGPLASSGAVSLTSFGTLSGQSITAPGAVTLNAGLNVQVTGVAAGSLGGTAGGAFNATGSFGTVSGAVATAGNLTLTDTAPLSLSGASSASGNAMIVAPSITSAGTVFASGTIDLRATGDVAQTAGTIAARNQLTIVSGSIHQSGGQLAGQAGAVLHATGDTLQTGGTLAGPTVQIFSGAGTSSFGATQSATVGFVPGTTTLAPGVLPVFTAPLASLTLTGTPTLVQTDAQTIALATPTTASLVELHAQQGITQTANALITTPELTGTAGYARGAGLSFDPAVSPLGTVSLTAQNAIATLGAFYAGGDLRVTSSTPLAVQSQVVAGGQRTIALQTPRLTVAAGGSLQFGSLAGGVFSLTPGPVLTPGAPATAIAFPTIDIVTDSLRNLGSVTAPGGLVAISPVTPGLAIAIDAVQADVPGQIMSLTPAALSGFNLLSSPGGKATLQLGQSAGAGSPSAGSISINTPLPLNTVAGTLGLYAQGSITETGTGGVSIGRTGLAGTITGASGGATTLGSLSDTAPLNHFDILGPFTGGAGVTVSDTPDANAGRSGLLVTGTVRGGTGDIGLLSLGQALHGGTIVIGTLSQPALLDATGHTVTLLAQNGAASGPAITEAATSVIKAGFLTGRAITNDLTAKGYDVALAGSGNQIGTLGNFIVGSGTGTGVSLVKAQGAFQLVNGTPLAVLGQVTAKNVTITANSMTVTGQIGACFLGAGTGAVTLTALGGILVSGRVAGQTSVTLAGPTEVQGSVNAPFVSVLGPLLVNGGSVIGNTVTAGATTVSGILRAKTVTAASIVFNGGTLSSDGTLVITTGPSISGTVTSGGNLMVTAPGVLTSTADLYANAGLTLGTGSDFVQNGGTIGARNAVTITAGGVVNQAAGGAILAGSTLQITGAGTNTNTNVSALAGTLAGTQIVISEPSSALTLAPVLLTGAAMIKVDPSAITLGCPACDGALPGASVPVMHQPGGVRPATFMADSDSIALGTVAADRVVLHAVGSITEAPGAALTAISLDAKADSGGISLPTLGNDILILGGLQARTGLTLADTPAVQISSLGVTFTPTQLLVSGTVRSGLATAPLTAAAADTTGAPLSITLAGPAGNLALGSGATLAGSAVTLKVPGAVTQAPGALLVAGTLAGSGASAGLSSSIPNQVARLDAYTTTGALTLNDAVPLDVTGAVTAGSLTLQVSGAVTESTGSIATPNLSVNASSLTALSSQNAVGGLTATAPGGIALVDSQSLGTGPLLASSGPISLQIAGDLAVGGPVTAGGAITFTDTGAFTVAAAAPIVGASVLTKAGGVATLGSGITTAGTISVLASGLRLTGSVTSQQDAATLDAGTAALTLQGPVRAADAVILAAGGAIDGTPDGAVTGGSFLSGSGGATRLTGPVTTTLGPITITANGLTLGGVLTSQTGAALDAGTGPLSVTAPVNATGPITLAAGTSLFTGPGAILNSATLFGRSGGGSVFGGPISTTGAVSLTGSGLVIGQLFSQSGAVTLNGLGGNVTLGAAVTTAGLLKVDTGGTFTQAAPITAGSVTVAAGGKAALGGTVVSTGDTAITANGLAVGSTLTSKNGGLGLDAGTGPLSLAAALKAATGVTLNGGSITAQAGITGSAFRATSTGAIVLAGPVLTAGDQRIAGNGVTLAGTGSLISPAGSISVDAGSGALALAGPVQAAQAVTLAGQSITGAGSITGATLTVTSSGPASFSGPVSTQGRQSFATQGLTTRGSLASQSDGIALDAGGGALATGAPVSAAGLIDLRGGSIAVAGPVLTPGAVTLNASGGPVSMTTTVSAGSVTVQGGVVTLAPSSSTSADSAIQVTGTAVTLAGQESAPRLLVTASSITLQGGQITVGGVVQVARSAIGLPLAADGGPGAYFETASALSQTGTTRVLAIGSQATVRVNLTSGGGTVVFSDLNAPTSNLAIGSGAGSATGQLVVNQLSLLFSGTSGSARLAGIVHQQSGNGAAAASAIFPRPDRQFQVNGCAVSSINCIVLNPQLVPVFNPLKELSLSFFREQEDDPELLVPNVTEQGL